tara:strand:- start:28128 stop:28478 length:351 start_codon:yes stop_codon:yes gene_type:complete
MSAIKVKFRNNPQQYAYFCDELVSVGDAVVVDSPKDGYVIVIVSEIDADYIKATKSIVCVVDDKKYKLNKVIDKRKKEIIKKLETEASKASKMAMYEHLSSSSPELKALLNELKSL